jgi:hypothetical protein
MATEPRRRYQGGESPQVRPSLNPRAAAQSSYVDLTYLSRYFESSPLINFSNLSDKLSNLVTKIIDRNEAEKDREMAQTMEADLRIAEGILRTEGPKMESLADELLRQDEFGNEISPHEPEKKPRTGMLTDRDVEVLRSRGGERIRRRLDDPRYADAFDLRLAILHADSFGEQETSKVLINLPEYLDELRNQPENRERFNFEADAQAYVTNHFNSLPETHALNSYPGAKDLYISKVLGSAGYRSLVNSAGGANRKTAAIGVNSEAGRGLLEAVDSGAYVDKSTKPEEIAALDATVDPFLAKMRVMSDQLGQPPNAATYSTAIANAVMFKYADDYEKQHDSFMRLRQYFFYKGKKDPVYGELAGILGEMGRKAFERMNQLESNFGFENPQDARNFLTHLSSDIMENFDPEDTFFTKPDSEQRQDIQAWLLKSSPDILKRIGFDGKDGAIRMFSANAPQIEAMRNAYVASFAEINNYGITAANRRTFTEINKAATKLSANGSMPISDLVVAIAEDSNKKVPASKRVDVPQLLKYYENIDQVNLTNGKLFAQAAKNLKSEFGSELKASTADIGTAMYQEYKSISDKFPKAAGRESLSIEDIQKAQNQAIQNVRQRAIENSSSHVSKFKEELSELYMPNDAMNLNPVKIDSAKQLLSKFDKLLKIPAYAQSQELGQMRERLNTSINSISIESKRDNNNIKHIRGVNKSISVEGDETGLLNSWLTFPDKMITARFSEGLKAGVKEDKKSNELINAMQTASTGRDLSDAVFKLSFKEDNSAYSQVGAPFTIAIFDPKRLAMETSVDLPRLPQEEAVAFSQIAKNVKPKSDGSMNKKISRQKASVEGLANTEGSVRIIDAFAARVRAASGNIGPRPSEDASKLTRELAIHGVSKRKVGDRHADPEESNVHADRFGKLFERYNRKERERTIGILMDNVFTPDARNSIQLGEVLVGFSAPNEDPNLLFNKMRLEIRNEILNEIKKLDQEFKANGVELSEEDRNAAVDEAMNYLFRGFINPFQTYLDPKSGFTAESAFFSRQIYGAYLVQKQGSNSTFTTQGLPYKEGDDEDSSDGK